MAHSDQSSPKRQKPRRKADQKGRDRLSHLPEHILLHILSFLPTETAAATSVLSKTWQYLWTSVPNLDLDDSSFQLHRKRSFANIVTGVLLLRRERFIRRFRLKCHKSYDHSDLNLWVSSLIAYNKVHELDIDLGKVCVSRRFKFPFTQQSCKTLVVLKLKSVHVDWGLDKVYFPVLKIFHLQRAKCKWLGIKFLPSAFPVLEEFVISGLIGIDFEITLPMLRSLAITLPWNCGSVRIDCPALTHLVVNARNSREFDLQNLLSLVEANIDMGSYGLRANEDESYGRSVMDLLKAISNVRILRLSYHTTMVIENVSLYRGDNIRVFHNLVQVELTLTDRALETMILMLRSFVNLECLTLRYKGVCNREGDGRTVDMNVPYCLTSRLTTFCSREFSGFDDEMKVTRYILENSLVLNKMTILLSCSISLKMGHRIRRKLCKYPRGSEGCQLEFDHLQSIDNENDSDSIDSVSDDSDTETSVSDSASV